PLSAGVHRTPFFSMSAAMLLPFSVSKMEESAGPGLTRPDSPQSSSRSLMPTAPSEASMRTPSLRTPFQPYHSWIRYRSPRTLPYTRPWYSNGSPLDSAHQRTAKGLDEPQSNERSTFHRFGIIWSGTDGTT